jgi:predicted O-methyltransferase YrrM
MTILAANSSSRQEDAFVSKVRTRIARVTEEAAERESLTRQQSASSYAITPGLGAILDGLIAEFRPRRVLEFGAGVSSEHIARGLTSCGGGTLVSVEQDPSWCSMQWSRVTSCPKVAATMIIDSPRLCVDRHGIYMGYRAARRRLRREVPFDLVLVDAPQRYYGRFGSLNLASEHVSAGSLIVVDDAGRRGEKDAIAFVLATNPNLHMVWLDTEGTSRAAILLSSGTPRIKPRPYAYAHEAL